MEDDSVVHSRCCYIQHMALEINQKYAEVCMVWSRVSNAADMSRAVKIVIFPESMDIILEFKYNCLGGMKFAMARQ